MSNLLNIRILNFGTDLIKRQACLLCAIGEKKNPSQNLLSSKSTFPPWGAGRKILKHWETMVLNEPAAFYNKTDYINTTCSSWGLLFPSLFLSIQPRTTSVIFHYKYCIGYGFRLTPAWCLPTNSWRISHSHIQQYSLHNLWMTFSIKKIISKRMK